MLPTSKYDFTLQTKVFIASDEIVSATHFQVQIILQTNMFITSDERVLCWGRTLLVLETNMFHAGDEHFSAGDKRVKKAHLSFSHTHTQLTTSNFQTEFMSR